VFSWREWPNSKYSLDQFLPLNRYKCQNHGLLLFSKLFSQISVTQLTIHNNKITATWQKPPSAIVMMTEKKILLNTSRVFLGCDAVQWRRCCLHLHPEDGDTELRNAGILPHDYTVSIQKTVTWIFIAMKTSVLFSYTVSPNFPPTYASGTTNMQIRTQFKIIRNRTAKENIQVPLQY